LCLVFLGFRVNRKTPVMVGANREEFFRRPTTSAVCCRRGSLRCLLAGADHGPDGSFPEMGTWLGVNETGLVLAVTNRRDGDLRWEDQVRSRGLLAVTLLEFDDPERATHHAANELSGGGYGGCNFLIANPEAGFCVQAPGAARVAIRVLSPGIHAITNLDLDDQNDPRIRFVHENLDPGDFMISARAICRSERILVTGPDRGTVSSSLILVDGEIVFHHVLGNPKADVYNQFVLVDHR
jgi:uncharacterized protein with NRDE domain